MGVKKLRSVFMLYALFLALIVFSIAAVNVGVFLFGITTGDIYPLASVDAAINNAKDYLQSTEQVKEADIPLLCEYVLFTNDGQYAGGSIDRENGTHIWTTCIKNGLTSDNAYLYSVINRKEEVLVLRYHRTAQFTNSTLRSIFPSAELIWIIMILLEILLSLIIISFIFGKYLGKKIDKLLTVVHKIEQQDLDFELEKKQAI